MRILLFLGGLIVSLNIQAYQGRCFDQVYQLVDYIQPGRVSYCPTPKASVDTRLVARFVDRIYAELVDQCHLDEIKSKRAQNAVIPYIKQLLVRDSGTPNSYLIYEMSRTGSAYIQYAKCVVSYINLPVIAVKEPGGYMNHLQEAEAAGLAPTERLIQVFPDGSYEVEPTWAAFDI